MNIIFGAFLIHFERESFNEENKFNDHETGVEFLIFLNGN